MPRPPRQPARAPRASTDLDGGGPKGSGESPWQPPIFMATRPVTGPGEEAAFARSRTPPGRASAGLPTTLRVLFSCRSSTLCDGPLTFPATSAEDGEGRPGAVPTAPGTQRGETHVPPHCHCEQPGCLGCLTSTKTEKCCALVMI